jgi:hypothetical protein
MKDFIVPLSAAVAAIVTLLFLSFLLSWPVMVLWNNCLVPAIPGVHEIEWLQAWGLQFLCGILFKTTVSKKD